MKKYIIAAIAAVAVFAISAFAASLQVNAGTLQAGEGPIGTCTSQDVAVSYGEPVLNGTVWEVSEITLDPDSDDCDGLAYSVAVRSDSGNWATETMSGTFEAGAETVDFSADPFDAEEASHVHLVVRNPS